MRRWEAGTPSLFFVAPSPIFLSPRTIFLSPQDFPFLSPRGVSRGVPRHLRAPREDKKGSVPWEDRVENVAPSLFLSPEPPFFCRPERSEGSLGACVPRDDIPGRRPERSEGCLANARQDRVGRGCLANARQDKKWALGRTK
jgi:hypothetical protein